MKTLSDLKQESCPSRNGGMPAWRRPLGICVSGDSARPARDPVGLASFGMDSHVVQYYVNEKGHVRNDGN